MSDMQEILANLIVALNDGQINAEVIEGAMKVLSAVPEIYHVDAVKALLRTPSALEEQPEDYLAVKTYTSDKISVGDEISVCSGLRGVYVGRSCASGYCLLADHGKIYDYADISAWTRTGRNFPAIPAIMEELKKA